MPKPFAAFDVDGTIFKSSLVEKIVEHCIADGIFDPEPFNDVYESQRRNHWKNTEGGYEAYLQKLVSAFVTQIAGVEVERFEATAQKMIREQTVRKFAFPRRLIEAVQDSHFVVAISGSPEMLVRPFLEDIHIETPYGSTYDMQDGVFAGDGRPVGDKTSILWGLIHEGFAVREDSIAVGDTLRDATMLRFSRYPVMFRPNAALRDYGREFGWPMVDEIHDRISVWSPIGVGGAYRELGTDEFINSIARPPQIIEI